MKISIINNYTTTLIDCDKESGDEFIKLVEDRMCGKREGNITYEDKTAILIFSATYLKNSLIKINE